MRKDLIDILQSEADRDRESAIKLASTIRGLENSYKNNQGMLEGLLNYNLLQEKLDEEAALKDYLAAHPDMQAKYGNVFNALAEQYQGYTVYGEQYVTMRLMTYVCPMADAARDLPSDVVTAARQDGLECDFDATLHELLENYEEEIVGEPI